MNNAASMLPIVLIGGGGHASVLADILLRQGREIVAVICPDDVSQRRVFSGIKQFIKDSDVEQFSPNDVRLVLGVGAMPKSNFREKIASYFIELGYRFENVIAETAFVSEYATIENGVQIMEGAVIQTGAFIGQHSIINTSVLVEHDCLVGAYNHLAPKATLCGQVETQHGCYIGANATVIQGITLGAFSIVGAGAILTKPLPSQSICYPFRSIIKPY
ncbi:MULTISPECIES: acetyltransferase [Vibrio]|uniref:Acetyltransferase n=1 Tax=Vibrio splendidus TaxID=29497 RepID=A0A2T5DXP3_VIBSP|nr:MULTISPECIES: acetyltransferase [Vibrio]MCT4349488.1 acetyltransferase [Vibrio sp. NC2]MCW4441200.1 acetyltransferase [Vibrio splendidus]NOJ13131.1 acetyltransferase [Vibrio splendidus]PTP11845.1 shikimate dehydrogenase [Vibrio splendidus]SBS65276.1 Putative acetyltransferase EpsM [Vibrio splendidus]